jgi:hypothetical protein
VLSLDDGVVELGVEQDGFWNWGLVLWRPKPVKPVMVVEGRPPATLRSVGRPGMLKEVLPMEVENLPALVRERPTRASRILFEPKRRVKPRTTC